MPRWLEMFMENFVRECGVPRILMTCRVRIKVAFPLHVPKEEDTIGDELLDLVLGELEGLRGDLGRQHRRAVHHSKRRAELEDEIPDHLPRLQPIAQRGDRVHHEAFDVQLIRDILEDVQECARILDRVLLCIQARGAR